MKRGQKRRVCVLIHGFRRTALNWEHVMWGDVEKNLLGRLTRGIEVAIERDAEFVFWAGGADAQHGLALARERKAVLTSRFGKRVNELLERRSYVGENGVRTVTEVVDALEMCVARSVNQLVLVSDFVHIDRCNKTAKEKRRALGLEKVVELGFEVSDTCFTEEQSVLFEPESHKPNLHGVASRLRELDVELDGDVAWAEKELHDFLDKLKRARAKD